MIWMLVMMEGQHKRYLQHDRQQQGCRDRAYMLQFPHRGTKIQRKLIILPCLSVELIDKGLDLANSTKSCIFMAYNKGSMACNPDFIQFIVDQCSGAGAVEAYRMHVSRFNPEFKNSTS